MKNKIMMSLDELMANPNIPQEVKDAMTCMQSCHCAGCVFARRTWKDPNVLAAVEASGDNVLAVGAVVLQEAAKRADN